jgi:hypothetical protein
MWIEMTSSIRLRLYALLLLLPVVSTASLLNCSKDNPQAPGTTVVAVDTIPPGAIADLMVKQETSNSLIFLWSAPGDDGDAGQASRYDIRYSPSLINDHNWDSAEQASGIPSPQEAKRIETFAVTGLASARSYYVAIKSYDEEHNESPLSNCPMGTTKSETMPPAAIMDLEASALSESEILLTWTAPGDDGTQGTASGYDIRYKKHYFSFDWSTADKVTDEASPKPGGEPDSFIVSGLDPDGAYFFAMKSYDEIPNESALSNLALVLGYNMYLLVVPGSVYVGGTVDIHFKAAAPPVLIDIQRINWGGGGYLPWKHFEGHYTEGTHIIEWDLTSDEGDPTNFGRQYYINLYWGETKKDSVALRVLDSSSSK